MDILPLQLNDDYISAEFLLETVYTDPVMYPIHFSNDRNSIEGYCCGHIKTIPLDHPQVPTVVNRTNQPDLSDFLWNKKRNILYYIYYDSLNHLSCVRVHNGDILYTSTLTISKLLGLIEDECQLIMIEERNIVCLNLTTLKVKNLFEIVSTSIDTYLV
jgi:hypothetical protein